jgi:hypothetical protein
VLDSVRLYDQPWADPSQYGQASIGSCFFSMRLKCAVEKAAHTVR